MKNAISDNEDDDKNGRHDMDVLRTFHEADFREFPRWVSKSSQGRQNHEQSRRTFSHSTQCTLYVERAKLIVQIVERRKIRIGDYIVFKTDPKEKRIVEYFCLACINVVLFNKRNEKRNGKSLVGMGRGHLICKFVVSLINLNEKEKN